MIHIILILYVIYIYIYTYIYNIILSKTHVVYHICIVRVIEQF